MEQLGNKEHTDTEILNMFGHESMSAKEFARFLELKGEGTVTEKTVKNYLERICKDSNGKLRKEVFQEERTDKKGKGKMTYSFPPKMHGFLATMMCSHSYVDGRSKKPIPTDENEIIKNANKYMNGEDLDVFKKTSEYLNLQLDNMLWVEAVKQLAILIKTIFESNLTNHIHYMLHLIQVLVNETRWVQMTDDKLDNRQSIEKKLIELLVHKLNNEIPQEEQISEEKLNPVAVKLMQEAFYINGNLDKDGKRLMEMVENAIQEDAKLQRLQEVTSMVLTKEYLPACSLKELMDIKETVLQAARKRFLIENIPTQEDIDKIQDFAEAVLRDKKKTVLEKITKGEPAEEILRFVETRN